jgi:hypothetical protein
LDHQSELPVEELRRLAGALDDDVTALAFEVLRVIIIQRFMFYPDAVSERQRLAQAVRIQFRDTISSRPAQGAVTEVTLLEDGQPASATEGKQSSLAKPRTRKRRKRKRRH